jgi:hypothetical protein
MAVFNDLVRSQNEAVKRKLNCYFRRKNLPVNEMDIKRFPRSINRAFN